MRRRFNYDLANLQAKRARAEQTITELKELRETLVIKNLKGTYSDELFQDQNGKISGKIADAEKILGKTIYDNFAVTDVEKFMREKFKDLGQTYVDSNPGERRVLLGSIVPSGLVWQYSGLSNQVFSPQYQAILTGGSNEFAKGEPPCR